MCRPVFDAGLQEVYICLHRQQVRGGPFSILISNLMIE
jgi:hypothetical protein